MVKAAGAQLRSSTKQCAVLQTYTGLIKNSQTQNGIRIPPSPSMVFIQGNQGLDLCPQNVARFLRFSPLWAVLRLSLTTENKWLSCFHTKTASLDETGSHFPYWSYHLSCHKLAEHWSFYFGMCPNPCCLHGSRESPPDFMLPNTVVYSSSSRTLPRALPSMRQ